MRGSLRSCALAWALVVPALAWGQQTGHLANLNDALHGEDTARAVAAASALGSMRSREALDALMGALELGAPPEVLTALVKAIGQHRSPKSIDLLRHFASYRRAEIRVAALEALARVSDAQVPPVLIRALGDSSPQVRAKAASLLSELKVRQAERPLFKMLRRGDAAAAEPLGSVAGAETAKQLSELIGELPDAAVAAALGAMLRRQDFGPDPLRDEVVKALGKIPTTDATVALVEYVASVPPKETRLSKKTAEKLLEGRQK